MERPIQRTFFSIFLLAQLVAAAPTQATTQACTDITNALPGKVLSPGLLALEYYLEQIPIVNFATRSGGHDPNVGHATVEDGILTTMTDMVGLTYDAMKRVAYVKPGGEWNDVIGDLEPSSVTITGGRLGLVGVGGYLLQGGVSFLTAQEGLAADNIVGWKTVMANGSIVNLDATTNPYLAQAMRRSGSQFGIVTKYTVRVHEIGDVWGHFCIYEDSQCDALYAALHNFVGNGARDPKAAIIFSDLVAVEGLETRLLYYFYDGPTRPTAGLFADFFNIPGLICAPKTQKYSELLKSNGEPARFLNSRVSFRMYSEIRTKLAHITAPFLTLLRPTSQFSIDFQPLPSIIGKISESKGGNAMGLSSSYPDRIVLEIQGSWALASDDAVVYSLSKQLTDWLDEQVPKRLDEAGMSRDMYLPLFMNDAAGDQPVTKSYKDHEKFKALQRQVDPDGLFSTRAGGFKY
ncbi:FAD-binding domain-containing protein [Setomelanomma holmii]|uniref:FAD-binding domain-containing protein n=1 Tax=Setomelanomma holmii TaxID=210430 RepID=A0A9P4LMW3_9PLEO|nr:FAD-binding domain-containing protein [Setomelanomma holmii]